MKLEEAIHQTNFTSLAQKAAINLIYTTNWLQGGFQEFLDEFNITVQQFNVLRILRGSNPNCLSTCDIRNRMLDKMSDVSRIVDRLVKQELVSRTINTEDKRLVDVQITEKGLTLLSNIDQKRSNLHSVMNVLSEDELFTLNELLDKLRTLNP